MRWVGWLIYVEFDMT